MLQTHCMHNEMLSHYNHIVVGCFKDIFQTVNTNNLPAVLQGLKELNFILANRAPELSAHCGFPLEPQQVSAPKRYLISSVHTFMDLLPTPLNIAVEEDQGTRGNQQYRPSRQSSPVPRYNRQTNRSDACPHFNRARSSYQSRYSDRDRCHSYSSHKYQHLHNQASCSHHNASNTPNMYPLNTSELIGSLQSQIIGLQLQLLQQSMLNSTKMFDDTNKPKFATWAQSIENAVRLCNLDAFSIALSKLQGAPLRSSNCLEGKETNSGKKLSWTT